MFFFFFVIISSNYFLWQSTSCHLTMVKRSLYKMKKFICKTHNSFLWGRMWNIGIESDSPLFLVLNRWPVSTGFCCLPVFIKVLQKQEDIKYIQISNKNTVDPFCVLWQIHYWKSQMPHKTKQWNNSWRSNLCFTQHIFLHYTLLSSQTLFIIVHRTRRKKASDLKAHQLRGPLQCAASAPAESECSGKLFAALF